MLDLRSDTVTKPSPGMRDAMHSAVVGDDVLGDDPTVIRLQERFAELVGKEAALYLVQNLVNGPLWSASETNSITQLLVTIGGSLAGPALESVPGRPRLFVGGGLGIPTDTADQTQPIDPTNTD